MHRILRQHYQRSEELQRPPARPLRLSPYDEHRDFFPLVHSGKEDAHEEANLGKTLRIDAMPKLVHRLGLALGNSPSNASNNRS